MGYSWRSTLLTRATLYMLEYVVRLGLTACSAIIVARSLGPSDFGLLSYVQTVFAILSPLAMLGLAPVLVREFSIGREPVETISSVIRWQIAAAVLLGSAGTIFVGVSKSFDSTALICAIVLAPLPILFLSLDARAYLEARGRAKQVLIAGVVGAIVGTSIKLYGAKIHSIPTVVLGTVVETLTAALMLLTFTHAWVRVRLLVSSFSHSISRDLLRESRPLILAGIASAAYMQGDIIMLGIMAGNREAGIYAAAARLSEVWFFLPAAAVAAVRPKLSRLMAANDSAYTYVLQKFCRNVAVLGYFVVALMLVFGTTVIQWLYGPQYAESARVLQIHILGTPFMFMALAASSWFVDRGLGRAIMVRASMGAVANIGLNLLLIPTYGATGAAIATLLSYAIAGILANSVQRATRPAFFIQLRAMLLLPPRK